MSVQVKTPTKTQFEHSDIKCGGHRLSTSSKDDLSLKLDSNRLTQQWPRKRRYSQTFRREEANVRRKRIRSLVIEKPILPNKFLLGGNIDDPLNLNGLYTSEDGKKLNDKTPQSSPMRIPSHRKTVEVRFPTNIADPLNLNAGENGLDFSKLCKRKNKRHNRHKKKDGSFISPQAAISSEKRTDLMEALKIDIEPHSSGSTPVHSDTPRHRKVSDKIVSPVIRQISLKSKKRRRTNSGSKPEASSTVSRALLISQSKTSPIDANKKFTSPKSFARQASQVAKSSQARSSSSSKGKKQPKFIYGNYNKYYGYRNPSLDYDYRLDCFKSEWFEGKSVLDIGCNVGHLTLSIARDFQPSKIVGIDIDQKLIAAARKNIRYYLSSNTADTSKFPISHALSYGPIEAPPLTAKNQRFPHNVLFMQGNFVLECDELLDMQKEEYDVILALSVTKWIHFNWGDEGLKRFFKRIFRQLKPGGKLILEPQPWSSYKKKKKLTEKIFKNFESIRLKPDQFNDYLLSKEIGFSTCTVIDVPYNSSKGFRRPIQLFTKSDTVQNSPYPDALFSHIHGCQSSSPLTVHHTPEPKYTGIQPSQSASSLVSEQSEHSRDSSSSSSSFCSTCDGSMSPEATGSLPNVNSPDPNFRAFGSISQNILNQPEEDEAIFKTPEPVLFACVKEAIDDLNGKHSEANAKLDTASHQGDQASNDVSANHSKIEAITELEMVGSAEGIDMDKSKVAADVVHTELKCASSNRDKAKGDINEKQPEKVTSADLSNEAKETPDVVHTELKCASSNRDKAKDEINEKQLEKVSSAEDMDQDEALETDDVVHTELKCASSNGDKAKDEINEKEPEKVSSAEKFVSFAEDMDQDEAKETLDEVLTELNSASSCGDKAKDEISKESSDANTVSSTSEVPKDNSSAVNAE